MYINCSANLLFDVEEYEKTTQKSVSENMPKLIDRIRNRIELFLKIKQQNCIYLICLILDLIMAIYALITAIVYGFGTESQILRMEQQNLIGDGYVHYKYSTMANRIATILILEIYLMRIININRIIKNPHRHNNLISKTTTYIWSLKLTPRAWLYIMGLTDKVRCKDKVHWRKQCKLTGKNTSSLFKLHLIEHDRVKQERQYPDEDYNAASTDLASSDSNDSRRKNGEKELFDFTDDFREINYQLKFPKQLLKYGKVHKIDLMTMRILCYTAVGGTSVVLSAVVVLLRNSFLIEFTDYNGTLMSYVQNRLFTYLSTYITIANVVFQMVDMGKFVFDCAVCNKKAEHTLNFATNLIKLYWDHRKRTNSIRFSIISDKTKIEKNNLPDSYNISTCTDVRRVSMLEVNPFSTCGIDGNSQNIEQTCSTVNSMTKKEDTDSIDFSDNIDRLIRMIIELRSDLDQLKSYYTIYLHMELISKIPCVILTIASIMKTEDLSGIELQAIYMVFAFYCTPIMLISSVAALVHTKVGAMLI